MNQEQFNQTAYLLNQLECSNKEIRVICNDGEVHINSHSLDFTYIGKFGSLISSECIRKDVLNKPTYKLLVLATYMNLYSKHNGGFNIIVN